MKVLVTGATGLIGQEVVKLCLRKNISVNYLTTRKSKIKKSEHYNGFYWNPKEQEIDQTCFQEVDAIIHLAGASISKRWTPSYKEEIIASRRDSTQLLCNALKGESHTISQIISASAIGVYPDSLIKYYEESYKTKDTSFLSHVVNIWEAEVDAFKSLNIKVTKVRVGFVLSKDGGALPELLRPIKYGVGSAFGSGEQWQSWIHIYDLAGVFIFLFKYQLEGVFNGVAPNPVSNKELVKTIAKVVHKPIWLPNIPKFVMQLILGEMHILLFESQRVSCEKLERHNFHFKYHHLEPALKNLLE